MYRFGIVYIYENGSTSSVYNIKGYKMRLTTGIGDSLGAKEDSNLDNDFGIFKMPKCDIIANTYIKPLGIQPRFEKGYSELLKTMGIVGYFFVRQARIPISLAQGVTTKVHRYANFPTLTLEGKRWEGSERGDSKENIVRSVTENLLSQYKKLSNAEDSCRVIQIPEPLVETRGIYCLDAAVNLQLQSLFNLNKFNLTGNYSLTTEIDDKYGIFNKINFKNESYSIGETQLVYIPENTPLKYFNKRGFATRIGNAESAKEFMPAFASSIKDLSTANPVRGIFAPFIGIISDQLPRNNNLVTIKVLGEDKALLTERQNNKSPYFSISDRYSLESMTNVNINTLYRGDCYTCTVSMRYITNFSDPTVPINDTIVNSSWVTQTNRDEVGTG